MPVKSAKRAKPAEPAKPADAAKRTYAPKRKLYFTADAIAKLRPKANKQFLAWDGPDPERKRGPGHATGLCILVSPGAKSWRCCFYFRGDPRPHYLHMGPVGGLLERDQAASSRDHLNREIEEARRRTRNARLLANPSDPDTEPQDPRGDIGSRKDAFEKVLTDYIEHEQIGRRHNSSARETEAFMLSNCAAWKPRAIATLRYGDVEKLLWAIRDGDPANDVRPRLAVAVRLFAHLGDLFKWAARPGGPLKMSPMAGMPRPGTIASRTRVYSDAELKAIWAAADKLDPGERAYIKLMMLLALRRNELALARWDELDDPHAPTLFTVPTARVKLKAAAKLVSKPVYRIPLPPLAGRIIKGLPTRGERLFPDLDLDRGWGKFKRKIVSVGAPADFKLHVFRHTVATWLENKSYSEWERGLVLNHASGNTVTRGYSHGHPDEIKLTLLTEWSDTIEKLVTPKGARKLL
jgi:integrase